jgi:AcrR family transcriptional regulator
MTDKNTYHHGNAREALLNAAEKLILEKGNSHFSLRAVAREVGIDPAACYRHFKNKEAILHGVASRGFTQLSEMIHTADDGKGSKNTIVEMGKAYVAFANSTPLIFQIMFGGCGLPALDDRLKEPTLEHTAFERLQSALERYLAAVGQETEKNQTLAMDIWAAVHGVAALTAFEAIELDDQSVDAMIERLINAILEH